MSCSNQTKLGTENPIGSQSVKKERIFAIACLGKKSGVHTEICYYFEYLILKYSIFHRVKELFKSNQTWHVVSLVHLVSKTKKKCHSLPRKKVSFSNGNLRFIQIINFEI